MFTRQVKVQIRKSTRITKKPKLECRHLREIHNFSIHLFPHRMRTFHLSTETFDVIRQRWTSNCLFPRQHFVYNLNHAYSIIGKLNIS